MIDFNKAFNSAKFIVLLSIGFNLVAYLIYAILVLVFGIGGTVAGSTAVGLGFASIIAMGLWIINQIINAIIIIYGGYKAAKTGLGVWSCGLVGLITWSIVAPLIGVIQFIGDILFNLGLTTLGGPIAKSAASALDPTNNLIYL